MKRYISSLMAFCLMFALVLPVEAKEAESFRDVPADFWAYEQINRCVQDGIVGGYSDGTFKPGNPVSYGAFSIMLARAFYSDELAGYSDQSTATGEAIMNKHGILSGTSRSSASIGASLPREDMAQCMYNVLVDKGAKIPSVQEQSAHISSIPDYTNVSYSCRTGVLVCYSLGLLGGQSDGNFGPKNSMNRAQGCVVINRLRDYFQNNGGTTTPVTPPEQPETPVDPPEQPETPVPPTVTELPEFKMLAGETASDMMSRICVTGYTKGYLSNGSEISDENITALLEKVKSTMPNHTVWDSSQQYNYRSPSFGKYWGNAGKCAGFAACLSDYLFSSDAPLRRHQDYEQLKVGDVIDIRNSANGYKHAVVVISIDRSSGNVYTCSGNSGGEIRWDGYTTFEILNRDTVAPNTYVYSRY
ncbi:S-layer homology domain-containing protein [Oscillibacter sp. 1-3]|uniref:S-layer homology domain-containing protein n=1 Tax=Oscillibacter sp. 1-3 TaxID=1235797 RepID=UPI00033DA778|nr:S-layer homology domain-containing protein [Oscillibacter sp. 1-3]EOS63870.1 hypothetical protein C816_03644 [Oscillibacter sp. 1-3]